MNTFLGIVSIALLFAVVFLLVKIADYHKPRCPRCNCKMEYNGTDENDREVWTCHNCGEKVLI